MKFEQKSTSSKAALALPAFALSAICFVAALIGPNGVLSSAPTIGGAGTMVGAGVFFFLGIHFRRSAMSSTETSTNHNET